VIPGLIVAFSLHWGAPAQRDDGWVSADKAKHFFMSAFVESVSFSALRTARVSRGEALTIATVATAGVGIGKEIYDRKFGGDPSVKDLVADGAGILAAGLVLRHTRP
jgi:uncharacterized protein YfiM (DUF2279 family)